MKLYKKDESVVVREGKRKKEEKEGPEGQSVVVLYKMGHSDVWTGKDE